MSSFFCFILFLLLTCLREGSCDPPAPLLFFIARRQAMTKRLHGSGSAKVVFYVSVVEAEEVERPLRPQKIGSIRAAAPSGAAASAASASRLALGLAG